MVADRALVRAVVLLQGAGRGRMLRCRVVRLRMLVRRR
jgi:hypothetical protein